MKKIIFGLLLVGTLTIQGQYGQRFFRGFGVFGAGNSSMHHYKNLNENKKDFDFDSPTSFIYDYYYPQSHYSREYFSWGAGIFAELGKGDRGIWQTEFEYTHKGAREKEVIDPFLGTRAGSFSKNKYTLIQWNNYLKYYGIFGLPSSYYIMPGVKIEYIFKQSVSAFTSISGSFPKIWFSAVGGIGKEFPLFKNYTMFTEAHWNPDVTFHRKNDIKFRNRTYELRVGIIYRPRKRSIDDCNAPRYKGPAY